MITLLVTAGIAYMLGFASGSAWRRRCDRKLLEALAYVALRQDQVGLGVTCGYWELSELEDLGFLEGRSHENGQRSYRVTERGALLLGSRRLP